MDYLDTLLPWFTNPLWILGVLAIALLIFHLLFVWFQTMPSLFWKKIDYTWLSMALLGLLGTVATNQIILSERYADLTVTRIESQFRWVLDRARAGTSLACRTFIASEFSPPPEVMEKTQREYDEQCVWFRRVLDRLEQIDSTEGQLVNVELLAGTPPSGGDADVYRRFVNAVDDYNILVKRERELRDNVDSSELVDAIQLLSPILLAVAIALRLTKVSGEIALEKMKD